MLSKLKSWLYGAKGNEGGSGEEVNQEVSAKEVNIGGNGDEICVDAMVSSIADETKETDEQVDELAEEDPEMAALIERCKLMFTAQKEIVSLSQFLEPTKFVISLYEELDPDADAGLQSWLKRRFMEVGVDSSDTEDIQVFSHVIVELVEDVRDFEEAVDTSDSDEDSDDTDAVNDGSVNLKATYSRGVILTPRDTDGRVWIFLYDEGRVIFAGQKEMGTSWYHVPFDSSTQVRYALLLVGADKGDLENGIAFGEHDCPDEVKNELREWLRQNERFLLVGKREVTSCVFEGDLKSIRDQDQGSLYSEFMLKKTSINE